MTKLITFALIAVALSAATSAEAQTRRGKATAPQAKRACNFQACFERCIALGGLNGSPLSQRHCGNDCASKCSQDKN